MKHNNLPFVLVTPPRELHNLISKFDTIFHNLIRFMYTYISFASFRRSKIYYDVYL